MSPVGKRTAVAVAVIAMAASLAGCGGGSSGKSSSGSKEVVIGLINPISGPLAAVGASENGAVKAAVDYLNGKGGIDGKKIRLETKDNKGDPTASVSIANQLISEGVDAIIGAGDSQSASALAPIANAKKVPFLSLGSGQYPPLSNSFVFQVPINTAEEGIAIADVMSKGGYSKPALAYTPNPYGTGIKAGIATNGVKTIGEEQIDLTGKDYTAVVTRLLSKKPDSVIIAVAGTASAILLKNLKEQGYTGPVIGAQALFTLPPSVILKIAGPGTLDHATGKAFASLVSSTLPASDPRKANLEQFATSYKTSTGGPDPLGGFGVSGWDAVMLLKNAVESAKSTDATKVRDALQKISSLVEAASTYTFSTDDHQGVSASDTVQVKFVNGAWVAATS